MFDLTVLRSRTGVITSLILAGVASCSSDDAISPFTGVTASSATTGGNGGSPTTSTATTVGTTVTTTGTGGGTTTGAGGGTAGSAGMTGAGGSGGSGGGGAGGRAKDGGSDGPSVVDAGTCTPGPLPPMNMMYNRMGWGGQWTPMCNFNTGNGNCTTLLPANAFDGKGATRTSIGDTHIMAAGGGTAQMIGDTFTFDMTTCNRVGRIVMFAAPPPNNQGNGIDARDFPGTVDVTVSSDCTTSAQGAITGTFGPVVAMGAEPQPGCASAQCTMPLTITFTQPVAAKCVRLRLTSILQLGGPVWWAIDELQVFP